MKSPEQLLNEEVRATVALSGEGTGGIEWPAGVSSGLNLPCGLCKGYTPFDWNCDDALWERVMRVAPKHLRLGVMCLPCFAEMAANLNEPIVGLINNIQFIGRGYTIVCHPVRNVEHWNGKVTRFVYPVKP